MRGVLYVVWRAPLHLLDLQRLRRVTPRVKSLRAPPAANLPVALLLVQNCTVHVVQYCTVVPVQRPLDIQVVTVDSNSGRTVHHGIASLNLPSEGEVPVEAPQRTTGHNTVSR